MLQLEPICPPLDELGEMTVPEQLEFARTLSTFDAVLSFFSLDIWNTLTLILYAIRPVDSEEMLQLELICPSSTVLVEMTVPGQLEFRRKQMHSMQCFHLSPSIPGTH